MKTTRISGVLVAALCLTFCEAEVSEADPVGTAFTYQGRLMDKHKPADGFYDFRFRLYDSNDPCTATPLGSPIDINDLDVIDGHFVVELDFGSGIFDGNAVWLETRVVRSPLGSDPCSLRPLLEVTPTPYAMYANRAGGVQVPLHLSGSSDSAIIRGTNSSTGPGVHGFSNSGHGVFGRHSSGNSGCLGSPSTGVYGQTSTGQGVVGYASASSGLNYGVYGGTNSSTGYAGYFSGNARVTRDLVVDANVGIGTTSPGEKLDVDGNININSVYKIAGDTVLSNPRTNNIFVGVGAGENNMGDYSTFVGCDAGYNNQRDYNTFIGNYAGRSNKTGDRNTFLGGFAGFSNTEGSGNTFLGRGAGGGHTTGDRNTFLGYYAGLSNRTGAGNVFIGYQAGYNETGDNKLYIANGPSDANVLIYGDFSTGNVGIGTMNPSRELEVTSKGIGGGVKVYGDASTGTHDSPAFYLGGKDIDANDRAGALSLALSDGHFSSNAARGDLVLRAQDTSIHFSTQSSGGYPAKMTIKSDGNVGIGVTHPSEDLDVSGTARLRGISGGTGLPVVADANGKLWKAGPLTYYEVTATSATHQTVTTAVHNFCALTKVKFQTGDAGTNKWCWVLPNGDGTWTLKARGGSGAAVTAGCRCF